MGCQHCPTAPLTGQPPAPQVLASAPVDTNSQAALKILTWNIWMMPAYTFQSPQNQKRAEVIAAELSKLDFDILCLQKAFSASARRVLRRALAARYPYQYGPANSGFSLKVNGGVWILSRLPLTNYYEIQFHDSAGLESLSRKGALMLTGTFLGHRFHIIATHLQGEEESHYTEKHQRIRERQMIQIRDELLARHAEPGVPAFLCGDFNTPRRDPDDLAHESDAYRSMLRLFGDPRNGVEDRLTLEDLCDRNDLAMSNVGRMAELDYVLVRPGVVKTKTRWRQLILLHPGWDGRTLRQNLSYRHAVGVEVVFE
jgi:endonuclease/exonuclease/phosphatase family metal-dependent hydrolase